MIHLVVIAPEGQLEVLRQRLDSHHYAITYGVNLEEVRTALADAEGVAYVKGSANLDPFQMPKVELADAHDKALNDFLDGFDLAQHFDVDKELAALKGRWNERCFGLAHELKTLRAGNPDELEKIRMICHTLQGTAASFDQVEMGERAAEISQLVRGGAGFDEIDNEKDRLASEILDILSPNE